MRTRLAIVREVVGHREPDDFERLVRAYTPYVASLAIKVLGREGDIDDVVQQTFAEAFEGMERLREPNAVKGWLATIAVRILMRQLRRQRLLQTFSLAERWTPTMLGTQVAGAEDRVTLARVYQLVERFSPSERVPWALRYLQGERLEAIAEVTGCSLATVKRRIAVVQAAIEEEFGNV
jgi:RNA polymerase sigma-70 factor, ECF subfamily